MIKPVWQLYVTVAPYRCTAPVLFCGHRRYRVLESFLKAQVTLCRSGGPDRYYLKIRRERHGRLMKSWQHRTNILEVCSVGKRLAVIGKPVRQSFKPRSHCADHSLPMFPIIADRFDLTWSWQNRQIVALTPDLCLSKTASSILVRQLYDTGTTEIFELL